MVRVGIQNPVQEGDVADGGGAVKRRRRVGRLHPGRVPRIASAFVVFAYVSVFASVFVFTSVCIPFGGCESRGLSSGRLRLPRGEPRGEPRVARESGMVGGREPLVVRCEVVRPDERPRPRRLDVLLLHGRVTDDGVSEVVAAPAQEPCAHVASLSLRRLVHRGVTVGV